MGTFEQQARAEILANYRTQLEAMAQGDTEVLGELLAEDFTLTHMTGYVQSKAEWLAEMRRGQFVYHTAEARETSLQVERNSALLIGKIITDAEVYSSRATGLLQLTMHFVHTDTGWIVARTEATTW